MIGPDRHGRATELFLDALDQPEQNRDAWLSAHCDDEELRLHVRRLLDAHEEEEGLLDHPVFHRPELPPDDASIRGRRVGPWEIVDRIGEGGMGVVYRAKRADGLYERTVALKLLAPIALAGVASFLAQRFAGERQILARLEHDGIARMYDGGVTEDGVPYLAIEYVDGEPITDYCRSHNLGPAARVALFAQACDAVEYAHHSLVVHRDLKPAHILVVNEPGGPAVKLLDFGVSSLLAQSDGDDASLLTAPRAITTAYASPEQLTHEAVTTATDVYSLGVVLYELLSGQRPYNLTGKTATEVERLVSQIDPPQPASVAPPEIRNKLRGDLDTIVMKALAKDPARRYTSAAALAADLRRHLAGLPVEARPATAGYRTGRFIRRHKVGVAAAVVSVLALVVGLGASLWQADVARDEAAKATMVNDFLIEILGAARPNEDGRDVRVASLLDRAAYGLDSSLAGQPDLEAAARQTLGVTYRGLGLYQAADSQLTRALAIRETLHGKRHRADLARTQHQLAITRQELGLFDEADSLLTEALATTRALYGNRHADLSLVLNDLGVLRHETGDIDGAVELYRESLEIDEAMLEPDDPMILTGLGNLAVALADQGDIEGAGELFERQVAGLRAADPINEVSLGNALANLGTVRYSQGRSEEAAAIQAESVELFRRALGDNHDYVAFGLNNLGSTLGSLNRLEEAEAALRESIAINEAAVGKDHPNIGFALINLAKTLQSSNRLEEAEGAARRAVSLFQNGFGADHPVNARALETLGNILVAEGNPADAVDPYTKALAIREATLSADHPDVASARRALDNASALARGTE